MRTDWNIYYSNEIKQIFKINPKAFHSARNTSPPRNLEIDIRSGYKLHAINNFYSLSFLSSSYSIKNQSISEWSIKRYRTRISQWLRTGTIRV